VHTFLVGVRFLSEQKNIENQMFTNAEQMMGNAFSRQVSGASQSGRMLAIMIVIFPFVIFEKVVFFMERGGENITQIQSPCFFTIKSIQNIFSHPKIVGFFSTTAYDII